MHAQRHIPSDTATDTTSLLQADEKCNDTSVTSTDPKHEPNSKHGDLEAQSPPHEPPRQRFLQQVKECLYSDKPIIPLAAATWAIFCLSFVKYRRGEWSGVPVVASLHYSAFVLVQLVSMFYVKLDARKQTVLVGLIHLVVIGVMLVCPGLVKLRP
jgi:hypothetical protein